MRNSLLYLLVSITLSSASVAQETSHQMPMPSMSGMDNNNPTLQTRSMIEALEQHATSGTDISRASASYRASISESRSSITTRLSRLKMTASGAGRGEAG